MTAVVTPQEMGRTGFITQKRAAIYCHPKIIVYL